VRVDVFGSQTFVNVVLGLGLFRAHGQTRPDNLIRLYRRDEECELLGGNLVYKIRVWQLAAAEIEEVPSLTRWR